MSKFFNESTKASHSAAAAATPRNTDIQKLVGSLKQTLETSADDPIHAPPADLKDLLKPLEKSGEVTVQMAGKRLENCRTIRLPRNRPRSFLVTRYSPAMQAAVEAYRTLRTRLVKQQTAKGSRSLVISSAIEGEGKTLTAFNLALCYVQIQGWPILAVDADLRTRGLSRLMAADQSPGLAGILEGASLAADAILRTDIPDLYVLPAGGTRTSPAELFAGERWKEFMGWASETFRLVIVDSPPVLAVSDFELILAHCESAMIVARARTAARESLTQILVQLDPQKLAGVVFNAAEEISVGGYYRGYSRGPTQAAAGSST